MVENVRGALGARRHGQRFAADVPRILEAAFGNADRSLQIGCFRLAKAVRSAHGNSKRTRACRRRFAHDTQELSTRRAQSQGRIGQRIGRCIGLP